MAHFKVAQDILNASFLVLLRNANKKPWFFFCFFRRVGWGEGRDHDVPLFRALRDLFPLTEKIHFASVRATVAV